MKRPMMRIYNKVVMTVQNIAAVKQLESKITMTAVEENERARRVRGFYNAYSSTPKWSFVQTLTEHIAKAKDGRIKCLGLFRCRQTGETKELHFWQQPRALLTHSGELS